MITLKLRIGKGMLEFQGNNSRDAHKFSAIYGALPNVCDNCKSDDIFLSYKSPKGNDYYTLTCKKCNAELVLHQKKEGGFYLKYGEKMTVYQTNGTSQGGETPEGFDKAVNEEKLKEHSEQAKDDIPF